jgi:hypothetical protein
MSRSIYLTQIGQYAKEIVYGTMLAIDPGSTRPGYAVFHAGTCTHSAAIDLPKGSIFERIQALAQEMSKITPVPPDVVVIEELRGSMVHQSLSWAVGVHIAGAGTPNIVELPIWAWKAQAKLKPTYFKDDVQDAIVIGETTLKLAQELLYALQAAPYALSPGSRAKTRTSRATKPNRKKLD